MPKPITSLEGFIRKLAHLENEYPNTQLFFRGHSSKEHKVSPSIFRNQNHKSAEHLMIRQLIAQQGFVAQILGWDSLYESSVITGRHEQLDPYQI